MTGFLKNHKSEWSSVRLIKLLIVVAILVVWVNACITAKDGAIVSIPPSILALIFICMGIGSVEKWVELLFGESAGTIAKKAVTAASGLSKPKEL